MRAGFYLRYALRTLVRGGQRSVFAVFCIAVGVMAIVALQLVGAMVAAGLSGNMRDLNGGDVAVHAEGTDLGPRQLAYFDDLKASGQISAYSQVAEDGVTLVNGRGASRFVVYAVDPGTFPLAGAPHFFAPENGSIRSLVHDDSVVVNAALADDMGLHVGDSLTFTTDSGLKTRVTISGEVANSAVLDQSIMLVSLARYTAIPSPSGTSLAYTWVYVDVPGHAAAASAAVARQITQHLPLLTATTAQQTFDSYRETIQNIRYFLQVIGLLALLIGGIGILNTMQVLLRRRQIEIAMLKTQGYRRRDLALMFGVEAALLGLAGGVLGAAAGVGASFAVRAFVERGFFLTLPTDVDPLTVASGVAVGCYATLMFALLPIARASGIRPLGVLRELPERGGFGRWLASAGLLALVGVLFFLLALGILGNLVVALLVVAGAGLLLFVLTLLFSALSWLVSHFPVVGLPRQWRNNARLALRNIGRQKTRSAATMLALFTGVFAIGLGLALGQGVKAKIAELAATNLHYNTYVLAQRADKPRVDGVLAHAHGLRRQQVTIATASGITAVNGVPLAQLVPATGTEGDGQEAPSPGLVALQGYNLGAGSLPDVTLAQGLQDGHKGRTLAASDAATGNALVPRSESEAPLKLKLGDRLTLTGAGPSAGGQGAPVTLVVAGFYTGGESLGVSPILVDQGVVQAVDGGTPYYLYALALDPDTSNATVADIKAAAPGVVTLSVGDLLQSVGVALDNIVAVIEAVASLALLAGILMIANAVALAMLERRREIGILKAIGHTSRSVLATVILENVLLGAVGAALAVLVVALAARVLGQLVFTSPFEIAPALVLGLIVATALGAALIAAIVAWTAIRVRPLEVLRYE
jgi:putative ABC transport system permease protein